MREERLGYECQTKGCPQGRIQAVKLLEQIERELKARIQPFSKRQYEQYLVAAQFFAKRKAEKLRKEHGKYSNAL